MANQPNHKLTSPDIWIRLLYMIVFWFLLILARCAVGVLALLQFLLAVLTGSPNQSLCGIGHSVGLWTLQAMRFLTFDSEDKPFPFQDWPTAPEVGADVAPERPDAPDENDSDTRP